jgi:CRP-like cAMP-binding protein
MAAASYFAKGNRLLQAMPRADCEALQRHLSPVELPLRQKLEQPFQPIEHVYFVEDAIASVVAKYPDRDVEIGVVGCEGVTGSAIILGATSSSHATYVQLAGDAQRMSSDAFRQCMSDSQTLRPWLLRYVHAFSVQTAHTAAANAIADLPERLARWLLMTHDRVPGNEMTLTHEFLATMLGTRRAGVTEALHVLGAKVLIEQRRGRIVIANRKGLEALASVYYGKPEAEYKRLMKVADTFAAPPAFKGVQRELME